MPNGTLNYHIGDKVDYLITNSSKQDETKGYGIIIGSPTYSLSGTVIVVYDLKTEKYVTFNQSYIVKTFGEATLSEIMFHRSHYPDGLQCYETEAE